MQIVTDSGTDLNLTIEERAALNVHVVPLVVSFEGKTYREGIDIEPEAFYSLLDQSDQFPTTSQPAIGDFAETYRRLAEHDPDILSVHISSGLSGTYNAAQSAAEMVPEANVTVVDAKTLSAAAGWQVEAAARALKAGWAMDRVREIMSRISAATDSMYTLKELRYLIHGGRISHMKGLLASVLNIKPMIGVEKIKGTYVQLGQVRSFSKAIKGLVKLVSKQHERGSKLRVQVLHSFNLEGAHMLRDLLDQYFECTWMPLGHLSLVLGAHTGPSMIGVAFAPQSIWEGLP